jgi:hypothetical protein
MHLMVDGFKVSWRLVSTALEQPVDVLRLMLRCLVGFLDHVHILLGALDDVGDAHVAGLHTALLVRYVLLHELDVL